MWCTVETLKPKMRLALDTAFISSIYYIEIFLATFENHLFLGNADFKYLLTATIVHQSFEKNSVHHFSRNSDNIVFDGRNLFDIETLKDAGLDYISIGRPSLISTRNI